MKLTFEEKKLLYTYGCADLELTRKRLYEIAGLTVDPDQNKLVLDFCRKLENETLADWYDQMFYFVRAEMECYTNMLLLMQDIEEDEDWGPTIFDESEEGKLIDDAGKREGAPHQTEQPHRDSGTAHSGGGFRRGQRDGADCKGHAGTARRPAAAVGYRHPEPGCAVCRGCNF